MFFTANLLPLAGQNTNIIVIVKPTHSVGIVTLRRMASAICCRVHAAPGLTVEPRSFAFDVAVVCAPRLDWVVEILMPGRKAVEAACSPRPSAASGTTTPWLT